MKVKIAWVIFAAAMAAASGVKAQVMLGTPAGTPNSGAILDAGNTAATAATYKGIYLPQVALTANNVYGLNTAGSAVAVNGMLIYNTATAGTGATAVAPGIYVWNNSVWNLVNTSAIAGNMNTNIYKGDGTLTANRNVNQAGFNVGFTGGNVGIGTTTPTNQLQVVAATATTDPVRFVGLQPADATATGLLVTDINGVIRSQSATSASAVSYTGNIAYATDSTNYFTDATASPAKGFDNRSEFSGHTFTAAQAGLYQVTFMINFNQRTSGTDGGDGYLGYASINVGTPASAPNYSTAIGKISNNETGGPPHAQDVINTDLVKLTAGQVIQFQSMVYGSTGGVTASYTIIIARVN
jgi:hypothetical protein